MSRTKAARYMIDQVVWVIVLTKLYRPQNPSLNSKSGVMRTFVKCPLQKKRWRIYKPVFSSNFLVTVAIFSIVIFKSRTCPNSLNISSYFCVQQNVLLGAKKAIVLEIVEAIFSAFFKGNSYSIKALLNHVQFPVKIWTFYN